MIKLKQKLESLKGSEIAVVMVDGRCFKGVLADHDESMLLLTHVFETTNAEIDWIIKENRDEMNKVQIEWRQVAFPECIALLAHVERIWPWRKTAAAPQEGMGQILSKSDNMPVYIMF